MNPKSAKYILFAFDLIKEMQGSKYIEINELQRMFLISHQCV